MKFSLYTTLTLALFSSLSFAAPAQVLEDRAQTVTLQLDTNGGGAEAFQENVVANNVKNPLRNKTPLIGASIVGTGSCQLFNLVKGDFKPVGQKFGDEGVKLNAKGQAVTHAQCTLS